MKRETREETADSARHPGWGAMVFSVFVLWIFVEPYFRQASVLEWVLTTLGVLIFLLLFGATIRHWNRASAIVWVGFIVVALLGLAFSPFNSAGCIFFIYAASIVPFAVRGDIRKSVALIGWIMLACALEYWLLDLQLMPTLVGIGYAALIGAGNLFSVRKTLELEQMSKVAERERIARDMHDVLGHTLSVIILKSELAGRLVQDDAQRAQAEIADVERISRQALSEVRETIRGYRSGDLHAEFERARSLLHTAGLAVDSRYEKVHIAPEQERVLALALREAVTNVVRHADAKSCKLRLQKQDGVFQLDVQDDGRGGEHAEGLGMRGMRERVEALGGGVQQQGAAGTRLTITVPIVTRVN